MLCSTKSETANECSVFRTHFLMARWMRMVTLLQSLSNFPLEIVSISDLWARSIVTRKKSIISKQWAQPTMYQHTYSSRDSEKERERLLMSQQHASVSQGRVCSDKFMCCHTETEIADQTSFLTQSQYTDTGLPSPSTDPITLGAWQGSHWSANF